MKTGDKKSHMSTTKLQFSLEQILEMRRATERNRLYDEDQVRKTDYSIITK